jgi:hypothetical protein
MVNIYGSCILREQKDRGDPDGLVSVGPDAPHVGLRVVDVLLRPGLEDVRDAEQRRRAVGLARNSRKLLNKIHPGTTRFVFFAGNYVRA